jgi:hypothetical protein
MDHGAAVLAARAVADSLMLARERFDSAGQRLVWFASACDEADLFILGQITSGLLLPAMQVHEHNEEAQIRALFVLSILAFRFQALAIGLVEAGAAVGIIRTMDLYEDLYEENAEPLLLLACIESFTRLLGNVQPGVILALEAAGAPTRIVRAMARFERCIKLQEAGCLIISNLAIGRDPRVRDVRVVLAGTGALERVTRAMVLHRNSAAVQERACLAICNLAANTANRLALADAGALDLVISAMDSHDDALVLENACLAIRQLARSEQNKTVLGARCRAHERIVAAMRLHQTDASVQKAGCKALQALASNSAENQRILVGAGAIERILCAMRLHAPSNLDVQRAGCHALWDLAASDDNKMLLAREGAHELLLAALAELAEFDTAEGEEWGEVLVDEEFDDHRLGARRTLLRLAETAGARVGDPWPVVLDHLRIIRLSLAVDAFAADATTRLSGLLGAIPIPYLVARVAVLSSGSELVPAEGWASQVGAELAQLHLCSRGEAAVGAFLTDQLMATQAKLAAQQQ